MPLHATESNFIPESQSCKCETSEQIPRASNKNCRRGSISDHRSLGVLQDGNCLYCRKAMHPKGHQPNKLLNG